MCNYIKPTMSFGNIVYKFHDKHRFSYTSTSKQPNLTTSLVWCKKINNLKIKNNVRKNCNCYYISVITYLIQLQIYTRIQVLE
jgi:hypothetical protein